jgi:sulfate transport system substrate-binding protein
MKHLVVRCIKDRDLRCRLGSALGLGLLIATVVYGRIIMANAPEQVRLVVYAFSTQEAVLTQCIFPAFEEAWEAETGQDLAIEGVFGPSGTLAGQINLGAPADVALFSNAQHVTHLKVGRRVRPDCGSAVIGHTPMVIVTRPGNPYGIAEFADLAQPGLRLLHADPRTSGAGQWGVLAEYGSALLEVGDQETAFLQGSEHAEAQLKAIWQNVQLLATSARETMTLFELGAGDAIVTYEQDALLAQQRGAAAEIVVPPCTIFAQHVAVVVDDNVTRGERPVAQAFLDFLLGEEGQQLLGGYHLRPAQLESQRFEDILQPFTVDDLGGWSQATTELVEGLWQTEIEPRLRLESVPMVLGSGQ